MMTDFKVGQKALWGDTIVTVDYVVKDIIVCRTENGDYGIGREYLTPMPATVTIELSREDAEWWGENDGLWEKNSCSSRVSAACRTALESEGK